MCLPVINTACIQNPDTSFTLLTRKRFAGLFERVEQLQLITPDIDEQYRGIIGLRKLAKELNISGYDRVIDLHDVLRSRILTFGCHQKKIFRVDKCRKDKQAIIQQKSNTPLRPMRALYGDVFKKAGYQLHDEVCRSYVFPTSHPDIEDLQANTGTPNVGYAPFAAHAQKAIPMDISIKLLEALAVRGIIVHLFGGQDDLQDAQILEKKILGTNFVGRYGLEKELDIMSQLDMMISTDSSSGHLAALTQTPVMTIWGATDYKLGFAPRNSSIQDYYVPGANLDCHPCSVYGKKRCKTRDLACLSNIDAKFIADTIYQQLKFIH